MLCRGVIVTLLVSISILRVEAWGRGHKEEKTLTNEPQTPSYVDGAGIDALTIQDGNVYQTGPNDKNIYGSMTREKIEASVHTRTAFAPGGPGKQGVSYASLDGAQSQGLPDQNQNPSNGGTNHHGSFTYQKDNIYFLTPNSTSRFGSLTMYNGQVSGSDGDQKPTGQNNVRYGSETVQNGNIYVSDSTGVQFWGSRTVQKGNVYIDRVTPKTGNSSEAQEQAQKPEEPNGQSKLSPSKICLFFLAWVKLKILLV